jgi:hypothetical protein
LLKTSTFIPLLNILRSFFGRTESMFRRYASCLSLAVAREYLGVRAHWVN